VIATPLRVTIIAVSLMGGPALSQGAHNVNECNAAHVRVKRSHLGTARHGNRPASDRRTVKKSRNGPHGSLLWVIN
jgi:hypothetical protein